MVAFKFILLTSFRNREGGWFCAEKEVDVSVRPFGDARSYFSMTGEAYPHSNLSFPRQALILRLWFRIFQGGENFVSARAEQLKTERAS
jgi:hypothetical protein